MTDPGWSRIEELFHAASLLPPAERTAYLNAACDDPALRAEVESLLEHDNEPGAGFQQALAGEAIAVMRQKSGPVVGRRIGPYRVTGILGQGGMGTVYAATRDDDAYDKGVAIKLVRSGLETTNLLDRFRNERQILAVLEHPYIARMLDGGATEDGVPYLVMERIQGVPITVYASEHQLSLDARLRLFQKVCEAVQYAHANLIIHRDIKPGNIFITADGTPKLLDFGLARVLESGQTEAQTTALLMTPAYASPEQVEGRAVTTSTDIYSLGAVLYELLTGRAPHRVEGLSPLKAVETVRGGEVDLPSRAGTLPWIPARQLSGDLDNILLMALRKDPARRYRSVEQFAADLRRFQEGRTVVARPDTVRYRASKFVHRNRWPIALGMVVFLALTGVTVNARLAARRERRRFDQVRQLAGQVLFRVHDEIRPLAGSLAARELILQSALEYLNSLAVEAGGDVDLLLDLSEGYRNLAVLQDNSLAPTQGDTRAAMVSYRKAIELARQALAREPRNAEALRNLGAGLMTYSRQHADLSNLSTARASGEEAVALLERAVELDRVRPIIRENLSHAYLQLGTNVVAPAGDTKAAAALVRKGIKVSEQLVAVEPTAQSRNELAGAYNSLARLLAMVKDPVGSREAYVRAVQIREQLVKEFPNNAEYARGLLVNYGGLADRIAEACTEELVPGAGAARPVYEKMIGLARSLARDSANRTSQADLAQALLRMGCLEDNEGHPAKAVALLSEGMAAISPFTDKEGAPASLLLLETNLLVRSGKALLAQKNAAKSIALFRQALQTMRTLERRGPMVPDTWARLMRIFALLAVGYGRQGDRASLDALAGEVQREIRKNGSVRMLPAQRATLAILPTRFGQAYDSLHDAASACTWWTRSASAWREIDDGGGVPPGLKDLRNEATARALACGK